MKSKGFERVIELLDELEDIFQKKNAGYAGVNSDDPFKNFRVSKMFGVSPFTGCLVRMGDKIARVGNLSQNPDLDMVGESITDTLKDLAVYCLIAIALYEEGEGDNLQTYSSVIDSIHDQITALYSLGDCKPGEDTNVLEAIQSLNEAMDSLDSYIFNPEDD